MVKAFGMLVLEYFSASVEKMGSLGERCAQFKKLYVIYNTIIVLKRGLRYF